MKLQRYKYTSIFSNKSIAIPDASSKTVLKDFFLINGSDLMYFSPCKKLKNFVNHINI